MEFHVLTAKKEVLVKESRIEVVEIDLSVPIYRAHCTDHECVDWDEYEPDWTHYFKIAQNEWVAKAFQVSLRYNRKEAVVRMHRSFYGNGNGVPIGFFTDSDFRSSKKAFDSALKKAMAIIDEGSFEESFMPPRPA